ncbi:hypothetical protein BVY05_21685, partial [Pectobacterium odoriferum]
VKTASLAAQSHADIPFEQVVEAVAPARSLSYSPLFQVMFTLQNMPDNTVELDGVTLSSLSVETTTSQCDLSLELYEREGQIGGRLQYATMLFDEVTVRRYLGYWQALLRGMTDNADQPVRSLPILPEAERRQVLIDFNQTSADYPSTACIHSLFEARAKANPDALALIDGDRRLSYGELNRQADRLARWLAECGVRRESRDCTGAWCGSDCGDLVHPQSGRRLCAAGSELSAGTPAFYRGGQHAAGINHRYAIACRFQHPASGADSARRRYSAPLG